LFEEEKKTKSKFQTYKIGLLTAAAYKQMVPIGKKTNLRKDVKML
jgi:hypothetical protein